MTDAEKISVSGRRWLPAIFILALVLRLIFLLEASKSPLLFFPGLDPQAYDQWAQRIVSSGWLGKEVFYQSPLYPYLLAAFYSLFGRRLVWVYVLQIVIGSIDCLVIYGIGRRLFGRRAGVLAGFFAAAYKPFIFYQSELLKTFLETFLIDLTIYLLLLTAQNPKRRTSLAAGITLGLGALARDNFLALVLLFAPWLTYALWTRRRAALAGYFLAGFSVVIGVCAARNLAASRDLVLTTSQGGQNFYLGNHRGNLTGTYSAPDFVRANPLFEEKDFRAEALKRTGRMSMRSSEISEFWFRETFKEIRSAPGLFGKRMALKLALFWNQKEIADNESIYLFKQEFSLLLRLPLLEFGMIGPVGLLGLALALRRRKGFMLAGYLFIYWLSVSAFYVFSRYRLAAMGPLLVFAGFGVESVYFSVKSRAWKPLAGWAALLAGFFALAWLPLIHETLDYAYFNLGNSYYRAGKYRQAAVSFEKAIRENPGEAAFYINLGKSKEYLGENQSALNDFARAVELAPDNANARLDLGVALYKTGNFAAAKIELEKALKLDPGSKIARLYLQMIEARQK